MKETRKVEYGDTIFIRKDYPMRIKPKKWYSFKKHITVVSETNFVAVMTSDRDQYIIVPPFKKININVSKNEEIDIEYIKLEDFLNNN